MEQVDRARWARVLTTAGWLFVVAWLALLIAQLRRAAGVTSSSFEDGVWGQRIEGVSLVALPQNLMVLVPGVACAVIAVLLVADPTMGREFWTLQLNRVAAGACTVAVVLAVLGIIDVLAQTPDQDGSIAAILPRVGGGLMAIGMIRGCQEAERRW